nr:MAG TPA_asm: hypothetical protein [Caudoviricetes sp.]DAZ03487.1 MAG TPA: hypothetical protein [Caudoviricetes sp.]
MNYTCLKHKLKYQNILFMLNAGYLEQAILG